MHAADLMTAAPAVVTPHDTLATAAELMRQRDVGFLPVVDQLQHPHLVGVLTDRDIAIRAVALGHGADAKVHEHMSRGPLATVHADASVAEVAERMKQFQVRRLPVIDEHGAVLGVIALGDMAVRVGPWDEHLVEQVVERISRPGALVA